MGGKEGVGLGSVIGGVGSAVGCSATESTASGLGAGCGGDGSLDVSVSRLGVMPTASQR